MPTVSDVTNIATSGINTIDALLDNGVSWNYLTPGSGNVLYYTFNAAGSYGSSVSNVSAFNAEQIAATQQAIDYVESVTGINFVETSNTDLSNFNFYSADILIDGISGLTNSGYEYSYTTGDVITSYAANAYIYLDVVDYSQNLNPGTGTSGYQVLLHEIGHALGLKHPFEGNPLLLSGDDTDHTLMSYTWVGGNKTTYQAYDLDALWWLYGGDGLGGAYGFNSVAGPTLPAGLLPSDTTAPTVTSFSPLDEAAAVPIASDIVVTFSETIQRGVGDIVLKTSAGVAVATYDAASSGILSFSGNTLTINPTADLGYSTGYMVEFVADTVKDLAGNAYSGTSTYNFTTVAAPDITAPTVTSFSPLDEAAAVPIASDIVVTFSETIQRGVGNIVLKTAAGVAVATYDAASSGNLTFSGNTLTINPTANLGYSTGYAVEFAADTVKDLVGNAYSGTSTYNFTTVAAPDITAPTVTITDNLPGTANRTSGSVAYSLAFSEAVTGLVSNDFTVSNGIVSSVTGSGTAWTVNVTPTLGVASSSIGLTLKAGAVSDAAGNLNAVASNASQAIDTVAPVAPKLVTSSAFNFLVDPQVTLQTSLGTVVLELNPEQAPISVANMLAYVDSGFYDNTLFHRVIPGFMVQGGGLTAGLVSKTPTYGAITLESNNGLSNLRGTIAMARTNAADSATTQFFINQVDNTFLNYSSAATPGYAVFGRVVSGLPVIDIIAQVATTSAGPYANVPVSNVTITSIRQTLAGSSSVDAGTLAVSGLEAGAQWSYSLDSGSTWSVGTGSSLIVPGGIYAANAIQIRQTDAAGNISASTGKLTSALVVNNDILTAGAGNETLAGGAGDDRYIVSARTNTVTEFANEGNDTVQSPLSWTLGAHLENLELTGSKKLSGSGNSLNNTLTGNDAANVLDGGSGADILIGGAGGDTYIVDNLGDVVQETGTEATEIDTVRATVNWTLGDNLENLTLLGTKSLNGTGNNLHNSLTGNGAANVLNGGNGNDTLNGLSGNDTLTGGAGADTFAFTTPLNAVRNVDTITDFISGMDKIQLSSAIFRELGFSGSPSSDAFFHTGNSAHDADDRVLYDQTNGALYYDADGTGALAAVRFAVLGGMPAIQYLDFQVA
jgi:cyclophilin family peptidyl-prolyl cis-trans isomerase